MNRLSPKVEKAFKNWIDNSTWHTGHPFDEERFYRFVWTVVRLAKRPPSESFVQELIISTWDGRLENNFLSTKALDYSGLYATLLEFANARNKPEAFLINKDGNPRFN